MTHPFDVLIALRFTDGSVYDQLKFKKTQGQKMTLILFSDFAPIHITIGLQPVARVLTYFIENNHTEIRCIPLLDHFCIAFEQVEELQSSWRDPVAQRVLKYRITIDFTFKDE
jgi:hypothetical protein